MKICRYCKIELKRKTWQGKKRKYAETKKRLNERMYCGNECRSKQLSIDGKGKGNYFYGKHLIPWNYKKEIRWRIKQTNGYVRIIYKNEKGKKYFIYEHKEVMQLNIKRDLTKQEVIHHINNIKSDNAIENLMLFTDNAEHMKFHARKRNSNKLLSTSSTTEST